MNKYSEKDQPLEGLTPFRDILIIKARDIIGRIATPILFAVDKAQDCWGEDSLEDRITRSERFNNDEELF